MMLTTSSSQTNPHKHPHQVVVIVMGVTGCGKSTLGARLASRFHCCFVEGDLHHPPANLNKMRSGVPLTNQDRIPWLKSIISTVIALANKTKNTFSSPSKSDVTRSRVVAVVACSALTQQYRSLLRDIPNLNAAFVCLDVPKDVIKTRFQKRKDHFMPSSLIDSQFETLQVPREKEETDCVVVRLNGEFGEEMIEKQVIELLSVRRIDPPG